MAHIKYLLNPHHKRKKTQTYQNKHPRKQNKAPPPYQYALALNSDKISQNYCKFVEF